MNPLSPQELESIFSNYGFEIPEQSMLRAGFWLSEVNRDEAASLIEAARSVRAQLFTSIYLDELPQSLSRLDLDYFVQHSISLARFRRERQSVGRQLLFVISENSRVLGWLNEAISILSTQSHWSVDTLRLNGQESLIESFSVIDLCKFSTVAFFDLPLESVKTLTNHLFAYSLDVLAPDFSCFSMIRKKEFGGSLIEVDTLSPKACLQYLIREYKPTQVVEPIIPTSVYEAFSRILNDIGNVRIVLKANERYRRVQELAFLLAFSHDPQVRQTTRTTALRELVNWVRVILMRDPGHVGNSLAAFKCLEHAAPLRESIFVGLDESLSSVLTINILRHLSVGPMLVSSELGNWLRSIIPPGSRVFERALQTEVGMTAMALSHSDAETLRISRERVDECKRVTGGSDILLKIVSDEYKRDFQQILIKEWKNGKIDAIRCDKALLAANQIEDFDAEISILKSLNCASEELNQNLRLDYYFQVLLRLRWMLDREDFWPVLKKYSLVVNDGIENSFEELLRKTGKFSLLKLLIQWYQSPRKKLSRMTFQSLEKELMQSLNLAWTLYVHGQLECFNILMVKLIDVVPQNFIQLHRLWFMVSLFEPNGGRSYELWSNMSNYDFDFVNRTNPDIWSAIFHCYALKLFGFPREAEERLSHLIVSHFSMRSGNIACHKTPDFEYLKTCISVVPIHQNSTFNDAKNLRFFH